MGGAGREFPPTQWTRILSGERREALLAELCQAYWKPIYCYLRAKGFGNEQAKDLVQGFFSEKVLGEELLRKADPERGRFRSLLLRAVHNYAISVQRAEKPCRSLDEDQEPASLDSDPETAFDRAWADQLLQEVLRELELECSARGKAAHWRLFRDWFLEPGGDEGRQRMDAICARHGVPDVSTAYHMVENLKRRFRAILRDRLSPLVGPGGDVEEEIRRFIEIFSHGPARK
jgi:RNA polymerase sigma-70 factor (ECF subfamily)